MYDAIGDYVLRGNHTAYICYLDDPVAGANLAAELLNRNLQATTATQSIECMLDERVPHPAVDFDPASMIRRW